MSSTNDDDKKIKLLIIGDVEGRFEKLAKKIKSLNKSNAGPFDFVFCVGNFFSKPTGAELAAAKSVAEQQLSSVLEGSVSFSIPVYFIAGPDEDEYLPGTRERLAPNLNYLGRQGIATLRNGLTVAYFSGQFGNETGGAASSFHRDVDSLVATWSSDYNRGVDILLTNEWSANLLNHCDPQTGVPKSATGRLFQSVGSTRVGAIAKALKPRYHFAGLENHYWARPPYKNRDSATDFSLSHVTRFVALGAAFHPAKERFVHAINFTPIAHMEQSDLLQQPDDVTESPFVAAAPASASSSTSSLSSTSAVPSSFGNVVGAKRKLTGFVAAAGTTTPAAAAAAAAKKPATATMVPAGVAAAQLHGPPPSSAGSDSGFSRWGLPQSSSSGGQAMTDQRQLYLQHQKQNPQQQHERRHQRKRPPPSGPCWFCLSSPDVEKHMVVSVGKHFYLALAKGGLVPEHLLIIPVKHVLSTEFWERQRQEGDADEAAEAEAALTELRGWKSALQQFFGSLDVKQDVLFFERHLITGAPMHMHIQVVPLSQTLEFPAADSAAAAADGGDDDRLQRLKNAWLATAAKQGVDFRPMAGDETLVGADNGAGYFLVQLPSGDRLLHAMDKSKKFSLQFGRFVCGQLLGMPDRVNWKACALSKEEETSVAKRLRKQFKPFDSFLKAK